MGTNDSEEGIELEDANNRQHEDHPLVQKKCNFSPHGKEPLFKT